jgi:hypothetical protein
MKILIDTPIWSKAFRHKKVKLEDENIVDSLKYLIGEFMEVIIGPIRKELLSRISDGNTFNEGIKRKDGRF